MTATLGVTLGATFTAVGIAVAGGLGAAVRHLVDRSLPERVTARFPWGIMLINLSGSFALGLITGLALTHPIATILATGFLGGYTTFSAASLDSVRLLGERRYLAAAWNGPGMLVLGATLALLGVLITGN